MTFMKILKFVFGYKKIITKGGSTNYYPMIPCTFSWNNKRTPMYDGLLDSGSDGIVVPMELAEWLGLELDHRENMEVIGKILKRYVTKANLTIGRGGRFVKLKNVEVSVPIEAKTSMILIGREPIFKLFEITFREGEIGGTIILKPQEDITKKKRK